MSYALVSVVMTTYNVSKYIQETIFSVLNQTYPNLELIIIDDGSTDDTKEILKKYSNNNDIKVIFRDHTGNIGKNLNDCIRFSKGEVIAVLGADDLWFPQKTEIQMKYLEMEKIVCSNKSIINEHGITVNLRDKKTECYLYLKDLLRTNDVLASSVLGFKNIFLECGLFDEEVGNRAEDYALWLRIAEKYKIKYIDKILVSYRIHGDNLAWKSYEDIKAVSLRNIDHISKYLNSDDIEIKNAAKKGIAVMYVRFSKYLFLDGKFQESLLNIKHAINIFEPKYHFYWFKCLFFYLILKLKLRIKSKSAGFLRKFIKK